MVVGSVKESGQRNSESNNNISDSLKGSLIENRLDYIMTCKCL